MPLPIPNTSWWEEIYMPIARCAVDARSRALTQRAQPVDCQFGWKVREEKCSHTIRRILLLLLLLLLWWNRNENETWNKSVVADDDCHLQFHFTIVHEFSFVCLRLSYVCVMGLWRLFIIANAKKGKSKTIDASAMCPILIVRCSLLASTRRHEWATTLLLTVGGAGAVSTENKKITNFTLESRSREC